MSLMILAALPGMGPVNLRRLDDAMGGCVERLLDLEPNERANYCSARVVRELENWRRYFDPEKVMSGLQETDADFITFEQQDYPGRLKHFSDRPIGLYRCRKGVSVPEKCIAIVGTRRPTSYGRRIARDFATGLSRSGYCIVSGLAEGIDTEAHRAALNSDGYTLAVLGGGLNRCYPSSNRDLMRQIQDSAGVWSEFPLWRQADRRSFPQRNRIVAGLSEAVLVVESGAAGGSLITARMASEQGKPVYVIPGRIDSAQSTGCHALVRDGAQLVTSVEEVLQDLNYLPGILKDFNSITHTGRSHQQIDREPELDGVMRRIWEQLSDNDSLHMDQLAESLNLSAAEISPHILEMELEGHIGRRLDGRYERR